MPVVNDLFTTWIPPYEGTFYVRLTAWDKAGNVAVSRKRVSWGQPESIANLYKTEEYISPNGDGVQDTEELHYRVNQPVNLDFYVFNENGDVLRTFYKGYTSPAEDYIVWDGKDESGNTVPDGIYTIKVFDYKFFVEVDNTPPNTHIGISPVKEVFLYSEGNQDYFIKMPFDVDISGYAYDENLKGWLVEYGKGNNPQQWSLSKKGSEMIVANDEEGKPIIDPLKDVTINKYSLVVAKPWFDRFSIDRYQILNSIADLVGGKLRMVAEDYAGNKSTFESDFLEEKIFLYEWDDQYPLDSVIPADLAKPGKHYIGALNTMRTPLTGLTFQYSKKYDRGKWVDWNDVKTIPVESAIFVEWDTSNLNLGNVFAIRIKARDSFGQEYYSNILHTHEIFRLHVSCSIPMIGHITLDFFNETFTDLEMLKFQAKSNEDENYLTWTDVVFDIPGSGATEAMRYFPNQWIKYVPYGVDDKKHSVFIRTDQLKPGASYKFRMVGIYENGSEIRYSNEAKYPPECPVKVALDVDYMEAECGQISETALISAEAETIDMRVLPKSLEMFVEKPEGIQLIPGSGYLDTSSMPEGNYPLKAVFTYTYIDDNAESEISAYDNVIVDRNLPTAQITYPGSAQMICPIKKSLPGKDWYGIPIEGIGIDNTGVKRYELYYGVGGNPTAWVPAMTKSPQNFKGCSQKTRLRYLIDGGIPGNQPIIGCGNLEGTVGIWDVTDLKGTDYSLKLKVTDITGNTSCTTMSFSIDSLIEITQLRTDKTLFSPNGDGVLDDVNITYQIDEYAIVDLKVFKLIQSGDNYPHDSTPVRTVASGLQHLGGAGNAVWDGKDDAGNIVPDGKYGIAVFASDSCGNTSSRWVAVEVDNTPPVTVITYPQPGDPLGNIIEVKGTADDLHFQTYILEAGEGDASVKWQTVSSKTSPVKDGILGKWNTYGLTGSRSLRLTATDAVGNKSETTVAVDLGVRKDLIRDLSITPDLFSPNEDGKLDATTISYEIADACDITINILDRGGAVRKTYTITIPSAGAYNYMWDGTDNGGTVVPDGTYSVKLTAVLSANSSVSQEETVTVVVDTRPPLVNIAQPPDNSYISTDMSVNGTISDIHLLEYTITNTGGTVSEIIDTANQSRGNYSFGILKDLPEGRYTLTVDVRDRGENTTQKTIAYTMDRTPPKVSIETPKDGEYHGSSKNPVNITGLITEENLDTYTLRYGTGDIPAQWTDLVTGTTLPFNPYSWDVSNIPDGRYTLSLHAKDKAGLETETKVKVIIDNTPPEVVIMTPKEGDYIKEAVDITGTAFDRNLEKYTIELSEGKCSSAYKWAPIKTATISIQNEVLAQWQALPPDGDYCLRVTAVDKLDNKSGAKVGVKVDTHPPAAPILSGQIENRKDANLSWTRNTEPDLAGYNLYRNNQKANSILITDTGYLDRNLEEGVYTYTVKAVDYAGWESKASNEVNLTLDLTGPDARIRSPKNGDTVSDFVDIKGTAYSADDFKEYRISIGHGADPTAWNLIRRSPVPISYGTLTQWDAPGLGEGEVYSIKLEAEDINGNISRDQISISIDNSSPATPVLISAKQLNAGVPDMTVTWQANAEPDIAGYLLYRNDQLANVEGIVVGALKPYLIAGTTYLDKGLPDGTFRYYLVAMDEAGNIGDRSNILEVTVDTHPPHAVIVDPQNGQGFDKTLMIKAESPDLDIASVRFEYKRSSDTTWVLPGSPVSSRPFITYLDPEGLGLIYGTDYNIRAVAKDTSNTDPNPEYITVTYTDVTPPAIPVNLKAKTDGDKVTLAWTANTEADLAGYNIYRTLGSTRVKISTAIIKDVAYPDTGLPDGYYTYEVTAVDVNGNESGSSNRAPAHVYAPVIQQPASPTPESSLRAQGSNAEFNATVEIFVDAGSGPVSQGTTVAGNDGTFSRTITLTPGINNITALATDAQGNRSRISNAITVIYDEAPAAPLNLTADNIAGNPNIDLGWDANSENDLAGYNAYRNTPGGWKKINTSLITETVYTDKGLRNGMYTYRVTAVDGVGNESLPSNEASANVTVAIPDAPVNLTVTPGPEDASLSAKWEYTGGVVDGYNIYRSEIAGGPYERINSTILTDLTYLDSNLVSGSAYYYVVTAVDAYGNESVYSNEAWGIPSDITAPPAPDIYYPTISGVPVVLYDNKSDIAGTTEPASTVELFKDGGSAGISAALAEDALQSFPVSPDMDMASISPDGMTLAYSDYNSRIWLRNLAAGEETLIIRQGFAPVWSPGGESIAYIFRDSNWNYRVGIYNAETGTSTPLNGDANGDEDNPSWSTDGTEIAFVSNHGGSYDVWIEDIASGSVTQVTDNGSVYDYKLSPDGTRIGYFVDQNLYVKNLTNGDTFLVDNNTDGFSLDWSPDGTELVFVSYINGSADMFTMDINTRIPIQVTDAVGDPYYPVWTADGRQIVFVSSDNSTNYLWATSASELGQARLIKQGLPDLIYLAGTKRGEIVFIVPDELSIIYLEGYFKFDNVELSPGENIFYAVSTDSSGNTSQPSDEIRVIYDISRLPDLSVNEGDIYVYPAYPLTGEEAAFNIVVWNKGQTDVADVEVDAYIRDAAGGLELVKTEIIPSIAAEDGAIIGFNWDSTGMAGTNAVMVVVDPADKILEQSEDNNFARKDFTVVEKEGVSMTTTLDRTEYRSSEDVNINIALINSGIDRDVLVDVWIEDDDGYAVTKLGTISAHLPYGSEETRTYVWNTGSTFAGPYKVHAVVQNPPEVIAENNVSFDIVPDLNVVSSMMTDKTGYGPNENVNLIYSIRNSGLNYIIPELKTRIAIKDAANTELFAEERILFNVMPAMVSEFSSLWDSGLNAPGNYAAVLEIYMDNQLVSSSSAAFVIEGRVLLTGNITVAPSVVFIGKTVKTDYTIANNGNLDLNGLILDLLIIDPVTNAIMETHSETAGININNTHGGNHTFTTGGYNLKTYVALLQYTYQGQTTTLDTASFTVRDGTPPVVAILLPQTGSLHNSVTDLTVTATDDASGVDTVEYRIDSRTWMRMAPADQAAGRYSAKWIPVLPDEGMHTISFRATDRSGNTSQPLSTTITIDMTPPEQPVIISPPDGYVSVRQSVDIAGSAEPDARVEMESKGVIYSVTASDTGSFTYKGIGLERGDNFFTFTAIDPAGNRSDATLHTISYTPVEISEGYPKTANLLVWVNGKCDDNMIEDRLDSKHEREEKERRQCEGKEVLNRLISELTDSYTIVYDKKDFQSEMRNPFYTDVLIIGDHHELEDHFDDELMERVYGGVGIISSKWHFHGEYGFDDDRCHQRKYDENDDEREKYDPVFGIRHRGHLDKKYDILQTVESPITAEGVIEIDGRSDKIEAGEGTTVAGCMRKSRVGSEESGGRLCQSGVRSQESEGKDKEREYPGIVLNEYGKGRAVYYAFDIEDTLNETNYEQILELLKESLVYVHRTDVDAGIFPYQFVGHRIDLKNMAEKPVELRLDIKYSPELSIYDPATGKWIEDNPWSMELKVPGLETSALQYYIYTPDMVGTFTTDTGIWFKDGAGYSLFDSIHKEIGVENTISGLIDDIITLTTLMPDNKEAEHIEKDLKKIKFPDIYNDKKLEQAIHKCIRALEHARKGNLTEIRLKLITLLRSLEGLWYFGI